MLHGVDRLTADIDLVIDLAPDQAAIAIDVLLGLGFRPHAQVDAREFANPVTRQRWREDSSMVVMSFWDPENRRPTVDLFTGYPMDFELLFRDAVVMPLASATIRVASLDHLVAMKRAAGRDKDLDDAARLCELKERG